MLPIDVAAVWPLAAQNSFAGLSTGSQYLGCLLLPLLFEVAAVFLRSAA